MSGLMWIQTVWHPDGPPEHAPESFFRKKNYFDKKSADAKKNHEKFPSIAATRFEIM